MLRAKIAALKADRRNIIRQVGETLCRIWREVEETTLAKTRRALFGDDLPGNLSSSCRIDFIFVEGGNDDQFLLDHYVLLGNFMNDPDRFEIFDALLLDLVREYALSEDDSEDLAPPARPTNACSSKGACFAPNTRASKRSRRQPRRVPGDNERQFPLFSAVRRAAPPVPRRSLPICAVSPQSSERISKILRRRSTPPSSAWISSLEEHQSRLGDYLNEPANARRLLTRRRSAEDGGACRKRARACCEEWVHRLEERDLLVHVLAGYELRKIASDYSPPIHLQQMKKALVNRDEAQRVETILEQFPARKISMKRLEESSRAIRRRSHDETLAIGLQFAEDLMRLRRDRRNYQQVAAWMERINLVRSEQSRELSRANKSLYEFLHPDEGQPADDPIVNHVVIKADVRGSTGITKDLLARGMNPASHFSMALHEPVKRMLERYGAAKVFIEGDAIILAIYETEATRASRRAVARACVLSREILAVTQAYNVRGEDGQSSAARIGRRRRLPGFRALAVDGRRLEDHDLSRAESFRPSFELFENGEAPLPAKIQRRSTSTCCKR